MIERVMNFGALASLPDGWHVIQLDSGHYMATNDLHGDLPAAEAQDSAITVDLYCARRWAFALSKAPS